MVESAAVIKHASDESLIKNISTEIVIKLFGLLFEMRKIMKNYFYQISVYLWQCNRAILNLFFIFVYPYFSDVTKMLIK